MTKQRTIERICPVCGESYDETNEFCPDDGTRLRDFSIRRSEEEDDPMLGEDIDDRFHIEGILGEGGMGKVYKGKQLSVNRDVAIKVLRSGLASDEKIVKRFFREAQVISQFSHPNIVSLVDFGQDMEHDVLYLAMEFIDGTELGDLIHGNRLVPAFAVEIVLQACEALSEPHGVGVVHRDLKPENLMLLTRSDGRVQAKVVDFGIAHALQTETKLTQTGSVFGTAHYMAPEQASGGDVGSFTDVYALGCILFELLTGAVPFQGDTAMQLLMQHVHDAPPVLAQVMEPSEEIDELSELVFRMMAKMPDDRPDSVLAVRDRLEQIQRKFAHPKMRVKMGDTPEEMFAPWLRDPLDISAAASQGAINRGTDAPITTNRTSDHTGVGIADTIAPTGPEEVIAFDQTGAAASVEQPVIESTGAQSAVNQQATDRSTMSTAAIAAQVNGGRNRTIILAVAVVAMALIVGVGAVVAVSMSEDEASEDPDVVVADQDDADELDEPTQAQDEPDEEDDEAPEEVAADEDDEVAGDEEEDDDEDEDEELAETEPEEEPEAEPSQPAARPEPRPQPRPQPRPEPRPQPRPEPPAEEETTAQDSDDDEDSGSDSQQLQIFTVD